ncbi:uncharacterized protein LOC126319848 [Schistocerca gregaria]|uniref:uncharacterized protein LOC126319848 n=1 Tax=Schistocerca gregaria TaxID=7010 RepID=UPI00211E57F9|nr:uncharacterized protein LOC126319848 [Schistocerca gregaria]
MDGNMSGTNGRKSKWDQMPMEYVAPQSDAAKPKEGENAAELEKSRAEGGQSEKPQKTSVPDLNSISEKALAFISSKMGTAPPVAKESKSSAEKKSIPPQVESMSYEFSDILYINSCRPEVRYLLTQQSTFDQVKKETGAVISSRGRVIKVNTDTVNASNYESPEDMPLHLFIQADTKEKVDKAREFVRYLIDKPSTTPSGLLMSKIFIDYAPTVDPAFTLNAKLIGPKGSYVKHIQTVTGCKVRLRGRDSNYIEGNSRLESSDMLHLFITGPTEEKVLQAKALAENLVNNVKAKYNAWLEERKSNQGIKGSFQPSTNSPHHHEGNVQTNPSLTGNDKHPPPPPPESEKQHPPPPPPHSEKPPPHSLGSSSPVASYVPFPQPPAPSTSSQPGPPRHPYPYAAPYEASSLSKEDSPSLSENSPKDHSNDSKFSSHPSPYYYGMHTRHPQQLPANLQNPYIPSMYPYPPHYAPYMYLPAYYSYMGCPVAVTPQVTTSPPQLSPTDPKNTKSTPYPSNTALIYDGNTSGQLQGPALYPPAPMPPSDPKGNPPFTELSPTNENSEPIKTESVRRPFTEEPDDTPIPPSSEYDSRSNKRLPESVPDETSTKHFKTNEVSNQ